MAKKNMIIAMILSIIWAGLGLIYANEAKKGIILAVVQVILYVLWFYVSQIIGIIIFIIWVYSLYATYNQVKAVNGE